MAAPPRGSGGAWTDRRTEPGARGAVPPVGRGLVGGREFLTLILSLCWGATPHISFSPRDLGGRGRGELEAEEGVGGPPVSQIYPSRLGSTPHTSDSPPHFPGGGDDKKLFSRSDLGGENFRVSGVGLPRGGVPEIIKWGCSSPRRPVRRGSSTLGIERGSVGRRREGLCSPITLPLRNPVGTPPHSP